MKYLFAILMLVLIGLSVLTGMKLPDARSDVPVFYWVTDRNPARTDQVRLFHQWMMDHGHTAEFELKSLSEAMDFMGRNPVLKDVVDPQYQPRSADLRLLLEAAERGERPSASIEFPLKVVLPKGRLALDMGNRDLTKQVVQGVSGVAGDVQDIGGGGDMRYFHAIGLLHDVTEWGKELGFDPSRTYPAIADEIALRQPDGSLEQYLFPCNVNASALFVNKEAFRQWGQEPPPRRWTIEEFERRGKLLVDAANAGRSRRTVFFADTIPVEVLRASLGGSRFNETGTRCTLDEPPNIKALELVRKWTFVDRLLPSAADRAGFSADSGYGGLTAQMFNNNAHPERGQIAMMWVGRYMLIEFRKYDKARRDRGEPVIDYGVAEPPHGGFPNTTIATRAAMVYAGSKHKELAKYFLAFLASEPYNMQIVRDGDALPPDPEVTKTEEYLRPAAYPNEWEVHGAFADIATDIAIAASHSPFILTRAADRIESLAKDKYVQATSLPGFETPEKAAMEMKRAIEDEMARTIAENPDLKPLYDRLLARQERIDALKEKIAAFEAANPGRPVPEEIRIPLDWLENPFHRAYYKHKGWVK